MFTDFLRQNSSKEVEEKYIEPYVQQLENSHSSKTACNTYNKWTIDQAVKVNLDTV